MNGKFLGRGDGRYPLESRTLHSVQSIELRPDNLELILDATSSLLPFHFLRTGDRLGRAVVKLLRSDGASGSAFLVAPGILLTNHHVLPDPGTAGATIALANFEASSPGAAPGRPASVSLDPDSLFVTNAELDFTFCGVQGLEFLGSIGLDRNSLNIGPTETVNIIQHPRGRPKEVALRDNRVVKVDHVVVHYACSTEPGSSGSPVFNNHWEPVALHHASVAADSSEPSGRFLNEGIRISAIAIWLEIEEVNASEARDQLAKLRGIFGGIDPRVGFFGALGRRAFGRNAAEVVVDSYREDTDDLDLAFWNIRGLELASRDQLGEVGRMIADMGIDLWCLAHADGTYVAALREHLESNFNLDYDFFHEPAGEHPALAFLFRRSKSLVVERKSWGVEMPDGVALPLLVTVRASTRRSGTVAFQLVPVGRPISGDSAPTPYAEAIRHAIRRGHGEFDWVVVGEAAVVFAPEKLHTLADCDRDLLAAAAERDGAMALLTGPRSKISRVFVSPNLRPAFGLPETLSVADDRELPALLRSLGGHQPIALRLTLDGEPRPPQPASTVVHAALSIPAKPTDDDLERRIRDMLAPILAQFLSDVRNPHAPEP
ncbi:trypsin-like serine peptidase [Tundrisphaera lichenicola]|uniref:trypsin-like serine peptidase n=1 Tax=Tundrisphaera lichenicola TaxID=2029860 RepID=UPI003EC0E865